MAYKHTFGRHRTREVRVGSLVVGGDNPIWVQSMTTPDTHDVEATVAQILRLEEAGCELVRVTVPKPQDAAVLGEIKRRIHVPLICDIHFDYKMALSALDHPVDKIRINPGNIGGYDRYRQYVDEFKLPFLYYPRREHIMHRIKGKMYTDEMLADPAVLSGFGFNAREIAFLKDQPFTELASLYYKPYLDSFHDEYQPFGIGLDHLDTMTTTELFKKDGASAGALEFLPEQRDADPAAPRVDPVPSTQLDANLVLVGLSVATEPEASGSLPTVWHLVADPPGHPARRKHPPFDHAAPRRERTHSTTSSSRNRLCLPSLNDGGPSLRAAQFGTTGLTPSADAKLLLTYTADVMSSSQLMPFGPDSFAMNRVV